MFKNKTVKAAAWLALLLLAGAVFLESRRGPDHQTVALRAIPEACDVQGVWRNDDYPDIIKQFRNTMLLCSAPDGRKVWQVFDTGTPYSVVIDETGYAPSTRADTYTVNADGSLTISDEQGEFLTLPPYKR